MTEGGALLLLGGGGHAAVVADTARASGFDVVGYLDDDPETQHSAARVGLKLLGALDDLERIVESLDTDVFIHAAIGSNDLRQLWLDQSMRLSGVTCPPVIHPSAIVSPSACLGEGVFIAPRTVVNARAEIGPGVIINTGAIVEHDCVIGHFSHITPTATLGGFVHIGGHCLIGIASGILPGVILGDRVTLGAGAVATTDLPEGVTAIGVPAKVMIRADA